MHKQYHCPATSTLLCTHDCLQLLHSYQAAILQHPARCASCISAPHGSPVHVHPPCQDWLHTGSTTRLCAARHPSFRMERKPESEEKYDSVPLLGSRPAWLWPGSLVGSASSKPCTGVNASDVVSPDVCSPDVVDAPPYALAFLAAFALSFIFCCLATMRSRPLPSLPSMPSPTTSSPSMYSSSTWLKLTRLAALRMSVRPYRSFILRSRTPPLRLRPSPSSGLGRGLTCLAGGGSCHFSILRRMSSRMRCPCCPLGSWPYASTRASSVHLAATRRAALTRSEGGVCWMTWQWLMKPWCGCSVAVEKPARFFFLAPSTCTLHAGMRDSACRPPARPMSLAAISDPTMSDRLGAMDDMRDSTNDRMSRLSSSSWKAMVQPSSAFCRFSSLRGLPVVVVPVTVTTMTVAAGRMSSRLTRVRSISLAMRCTTRA
mmetsp:Transcript_32954/g.83658  ORF Transcript_32954/g.83658 Transcript_32954/m.83658 type:complete len:431 (+) Transcript_32954:100-1392(+)